MPKKILVVDDDEDTRMALRDRLLSMGYDVVTENNGHSALSRIALEARRVPVQGILLDLQMPMFDGMAVLRELQERHREIPIIIMSATADMELLKRSLKLGARGYLTKPLDNRRLRELCLRVFPEDNELPDH
jgi:CheY-like chemotaxis protein